MTSTDATACALKRLALAYVGHRAWQVRANFGDAAAPPPLAFTPERGEEVAFVELSLLGYLQRHQGPWTLTRMGTTEILRGLVPPEPTCAELAVLEIVAKYDLEHHTRRHDYQQWISALRLQKKLTGASMSDNDKLLSSMSRWHLHSVRGSTTFYKLSKWGWLASPYKDKAREIVDGVVGFIWNRYERDDQEDLNIRFTVNDLRDAGAVPPDVDPYVVQEIIEGFRLGGGDSESGWVLREHEIECFLKLGCKTGEEYLDNRRMTEAADMNIVDVANGIRPMCLDYAPITFLRTVLQIARAESWSAPPPGPPSELVWNVVMTSVAHFRHMVQDCNGWRALWDSKKSKPRPESMSQMLFYMVASVYCKISNLDITPEAETGRGPVDFKVSSGFSDRVLVEVKLSNNSGLLHGYATQLELYKKAQQTTKAIYLIIDVGGLGNKLKQVYAHRDAARTRGETVSEIVVVDGTEKKSASKA